MSAEPPVRLSTVSGVVLTRVLQFHQDELVKTVLLAGLGGASSFVCTCAVKYVIRLIAKKLK